MKLLDMYDGFSIVQIHWRDLHTIVEALDQYDGDASTRSSTLANEAIGIMQTFFEAAMFAGRLQVEFDADTLRRFRTEHGIRDWQPDEALYDRKPLDVDAAD